MLALLLILSVTPIRGTEPISVTVNTNSDITKGRICLVLDGPLVDISCWQAEEQYKRMVRRFVSLPWGNYCLFGLVDGKRVIQPIKIKVDCASHIPGGCEYIYDRFDFPEIGRPDDETSVPEVCNLTILQEDLWR